MAEFNTKLHKVLAPSLKVSFRGWFTPEIFTVNISSWKIHELILSVTAITE